MTRFIIILAVVMISATSCGDKPQTSGENTEATAISTSDTGTTKVVASFDGLDRKPRFGGCNDVKDPVELKSCSDKKLAKFISNNLQYPENARKMKIEGKAVVSFVIEPNGSLSDITAMTNLGGGLEEEALRVFKLMNEKKLWWVAGMKDGKHQRVKLQLPITFKM